MTPEEIRNELLNDYDTPQWAFFCLLREAVALFAEYVALKREEATKPPAIIPWPLTVPSVSPAPIWNPGPLTPNTVPYPSSPTWPTITCGGPTVAPKTAGVPVVVPKTLCQSGTATACPAVKDQNQKVEKVETLADRSPGCYTNNNPWGVSLE